MPRITTAPLADTSGIGQRLAKVAEGASPLAGVTVARLHELSDGAASTPAIRPPARPAAPRPPAPWRPGTPSNGFLAQVYGRPGPQPPLAAQAAALQAAGRAGDTILAHINPREAALLKALGGRGKPNPVTGALEFFESESADGNSDTDRNGGQETGDSGSASSGSMSEAAADAAANPDEPGRTAPAPDDRSAWDRVADFLGLSSDRAKTAAVEKGISLASQGLGLAGGPLGLIGGAVVDFNHSTVHDILNGLADVRDAITGRHSDRTPEAPGADPDHGSGGGDTGIGGTGSGSSDTNLIPPSARAPLPVWQPPNALSGVQLQALSPQMRAAGYGAGPTSAAIATPMMWNPPGSPAARLAQTGVGEDSLMAHLTPDQMALLAGLGGSGTPNAITGLQQFDDTGASSVMGPAPNSPAPPGWDAKGYLAANPDVAAAAQKYGEDPAQFAQWHYQTFGQAEGRAPGDTPKGWNAQGYLAANPDVAAWADSGPKPFNSADQAALFHYDTFGRNEGRNWDTGGGGSGAPLKNAGSTDTGPSNQDILDRLNQALAQYNSPTNPDGTWRSAEPSDWNASWGKNGAAGWNTDPNGGMNGVEAQTPSITSPRPSAGGLSNVFASQVALSPDRDPRFRDRRNGATPAYNFEG